MSGFPSGGGLPSGVNVQSGAGDPTGSVVPNGVASIYEDTTNGGAYLAIGATSASWKALGGLGAGTERVGVSMEDASRPRVLCPPDGLVILADTFYNVGNGNCLLFDSSVLDGNQRIKFVLGSGNKVWLFDTDGTSTFPGGIGTTPAFQALTTPPVSTTIYQNTKGVDLRASLRVVLAVNPVLASDCKVEISPDSFGSAQTWADPGYAAGAVAVGSDPEYIDFPIPRGWFYRVTATNATIGALVAVG